MDPSVHRNSPTIPLAAQCSTAKPRLARSLGFPGKVYFSLGIYLVERLALGFISGGVPWPPEDKAYALRHRQWMDPRPKRQTSWTRAESQTRPSCRHRPLTSPSSRAAARLAGGVDPLLITFGEGLSSRCHIGHGRQREPAERNVDRIGQNPGAPDAHHLAAGQRLRRASIRGHRLATNLAHRSECSRAQDRTSLHFRQLTKVKRGRPEGDPPGVSLQGRVIRRLSQGSNGQPRGHLRRIRCRRSGSAERASSRSPLSVAFTD